MKYAVIILLSAVPLVVEGCAAGVNCTNSGCADVSTGGLHGQACSEVKPEIQPESSEPKETIREISPEEVEALTNARKWVKEGETYIDIYLQSPVVPYDGWEQLCNLAKLQALSGDSKGATALFKRLEQYFAATPAAPFEEKSLIRHISCMEAAAGLHDMAMANAMKCNNADRDMVLAGIVCEEALAGRYDDAAKAVETMRRGREPMYTRIVHAAVAADDYGVAIRMAAQADRPISMFVFIAVQAAKAGDEETTRQTFRRALSEVNPVNPVQTYDLIEIARGQIEAGMTTDAGATLTKITQDYSNDIGLLTRVADLKLDLGDQAAAATMLEKAKVLLSKETSRETLYRFSAVAEVEAKAVGKVVALKTFKQAQEFATKNKYPDMMEHIPVAMARAGLYAEAKAEAAKLPSSAISRTMREIAQIECRAGLYEQAKKTAESIASGHRTYMYQEIMFAQASEGKFDEAFKTLDLFKDVDEIVMLEMRLLDMEVAAGKTERFEKMLKSLRSKFGQNSYILIQTCEMLAYIGKDAILNEIYDEADSNKMIICVASAQGYTKRAKVLADKEIE